MPSYSLGGSEPGGEGGLPRSCTGGVRWCLWEKGKRLVNGFLNPEVYRF